MGIGNTTPSAALIAAVTGRPPAEVTGRGAGADDDVLARKVDGDRAAARTGAEHGRRAHPAAGGRRPRDRRPRRVHASAARPAGVPVIIDGVIAAAAALVAVSLCPDSRRATCSPATARSSPGSSAALDAPRPRAAPRPRPAPRRGHRRHALALPVLQAVGQAPPRDGHLRQRRRHREVAGAGQHRRARSTARILSRNTTRSGPDPGQEAPTPRPSAVPVPKHDPIGPDPGTGSAATGCGPDPTLVGAGAPCRTHRPDAVDAATSWPAQVRELVVGDEPPIARLELADEDDPGLFGPGSVTWRIHADNSMFVGGLRALLLQTVHPLAMAGVAEHSQLPVRSDGSAVADQRLRRRHDLRHHRPRPASAIAMVKRVHERVVGTAPDGRPYAANDPHLLTWVHHTLVDSFLRAYRRYGAAPDRPRPTPTATWPRWPCWPTSSAAEPAARSVAELRAWFRAEKPRAARRPARPATRCGSCMFPPLPLISRPAYGVIASAAVGLLPRSVRRDLWLPVGAGRRPARGAPGHPHADAHPRLGHVQPRGPSPPSPPDLPARPGPTSEAPTRPGRRRPD